MITSSFISSKCEDWLASIKIRNAICDIFVNPGSQDLKDLFQSLKMSRAGESVRYVVDAKARKVYVWDAYLLSHEDFAKYQGVSNFAKYMTPNIHVGYSSFQNGKISFSDPSPLDKSSVYIYGLKHLLEYTEISKYSLKDYLKEYDDFLVPFYKYNWSFADRYISGVSQFLQGQYKIYQKARAELESRLND